MGTLLTPHDLFLSLVHDQLELQFAPLRGFPVGMRGIGCLVPILGGRRIATLVRLGGGACPSGGCHVGTAVQLVGPAPTPHGALGGRQASVGHRCQPRTSHTCKTCHNLRQGSNNEQMNVIKLIFLHTVLIIELRRAFTRKLMLPLQHIWNILHRFSHCFFEATTV